MKKALYDYIFHFNSYTEYWNAIKRDRKDAYFNGELNENEVIKNKDINILIDYITKLS
jgi:hypothetical protein